MLLDIEATATQNHNGTWSRTFGLQAGQTAGEGRSRANSRPCWTSNFESKRLLHECQQDLKSLSNIAPQRLISVRLAFAILVH